MPTVLMESPGATLYSLSPDWVRDCGASTVNADSQRHWAAKTKTIGKLFIWPRVFLQFKSRASSFNFRALGSMTKILKLVAEKTREILCTLAQPVATTSPPSALEGR